MQIDEFIPLFHEMEIEHELFSLNSADAELVWDVLRVEFYCSLERILMGGGNAVRSDHLAQVKEKVIKGLQCLLGSMETWNKYQNLEPVDYIVFKLSRHKGLLGEPLDFASEDGSRALQKRGRCLAVESHDIKSADLNIQEVIRCGRLMGWTPRLERPLVDSCVSSISRAIKSTFNIDHPDTMRIVKQAYGKHLLERRIWSSIFDRTRPSLVLMTQNGMQKGLLAEARNRTIPVVECQHGYISKVHPAYSYPMELKRGRSIALPTGMMLFSDYWASRCQMPGTKLFITGNNRYCNNGNQRSTRKGAVVVPIANDFNYFLFPIIKEVSRQVLNRHFILKLHPSEQRDLYRIKMEFKDFPNVEVMGSEGVFSDLLNEASGLVVIYSTTAYEALERGVPIYILRKGIYRGLSDLFDLPGVIGFDTPEALAEILKSADLSLPAQRSGFFSRFEPKVFEDMVDALSRKNVEQPKERPEGVI